MNTGRAIIVERTGEAGRAALAERPIPSPADGEVLIEVGYSSLNYKDALALAGHPGIVRHAPLVAGIDAAGTVKQSRSDAFKPGMPVIVSGYQLGQTHDGGYADWLSVPAEWVVPLPEGLSLYESMALGTAGFTAGLAIQRMLDNGQSPDRGPILVNGATGGVGGFAVNILSMLGYTVTAMTGKPDSGDYLRDLGAAGILDRDAIDLEDKKPLLKTRWGGAVDNLGGDILAWLTRTVGQRGNIAAIGLAAGTELNTTVMPFILRGVALLGIDSALTEMPLRRRIWRKLAGEWRPSRLERIAGRTIALDEVPGVAEQMRAGAIQGRYVVAVGRQAISGRTTE